MKKQEDITEIKYFLFKMINNFGFFLASVIFCLIIAFGFNRYSKNIYEVSSTILFNQESNSSSISTAEAIYSNNIFEKSSKNLIANKIYEINSYPLIYKTVSDLNFDIIYYTIGKIKYSETYESPFLVEVLKNKSNILNKSFKLSAIDKNQFRIYNKTLNIDNVYKYGKKINFLGSIIKVSKNPSVKSDNNKNASFLVKFKDIQKITKKYQSNLTFEREQKNSSIIKVKLKCFDEMKGVVFLNRLIKNFISSEISEKNSSSKKTAKFLEKKLNSLKDSLENVENNIQLFKEKNGITDISLKAQEIYTKISKNEEILSVNISRINYFDYLFNFLDTSKNLEYLKLPTIAFEDDLTLNSLLSDLIEVNFKKSLLSDAGKIRNPALKTYERTINQLTNNLKEIITISKDELKTSNNQLNQNIKNLNFDIMLLPEVEKELFKIQRIQSINDNIYTFLLKKKSEIDITSSSNISDTRVIESAIFFNKKPFFPNKKQNIILALIIGFLLPTIVFFVYDFFNDKIVSKNDLQKISSIPIIGFIASNKNKFSLLSKLNPKSILFEGFRAIRSNVNYINEKKESKVYLVTSSISGEGKTFFSENLSIVFANSGKKTILIGADLRKPKVWSDFSLKNNIGLTNYITSDCKLNSIISDVGIDNLSLIISGPIPNNPFEILINKKFKKLINTLRKKYDAIIIDTPPLGLVADSLTLMDYSDINFYIVRQSYTEKSMLSYANDLYNKGRLGEAYIVFNDVKEGSGVYGYGYGYGYSYGNSYQKHKNKFINEGDLNGSKSVNQYFEKNE